MATPPPTIVSIASLYAICTLSFGRLCQLLENNSSEFSDQISLVALQDELGRFRVWAGNAGAHRTGRVSLDHKLRESSAIHATVAELVRDLDGSLREIIAIVSHTREPAEQWASDSSDSSLDGGSGSEPEDPTTSTTELEERFLEVKHIITCLYKLSIAIQNPASRDRLQRCAKIEVDHYEYFDIAHASQKFPFAEQYLVDRLGKANTKRRQLFQYHEQHHDKIALYIDAAIDPELDQQDTRGDGLDGGALEADVDPALKIECPTAGIVTIAKTANTQTTVSTFVERSARQAKGSDTGRSQTSYATSVGDDTDTKLRIPAPPGIAREFDGEPFECPYCFSMTAVVNSRSWMKHVFRDLRPYICTFRDCPKPDRLFQSRHEWFDHEVVVHRREWFCNSCSDIFPTRAQFMHHLRVTHPSIDPGKQSDAVVDRCERAIQSGQPCPICNVEFMPRQLQSHLGRHMQQLAIFALPKSADGTVNEGGDGDEESTEHSVLGSFESNPEQGDASHLHRSLPPLPEAEFLAPANFSMRDDTKEGIDDYPDSERGFIRYINLNTTSVNMDNANQTVDTTETSAEHARHPDGNTEDPLPVPSAETAEPNGSHPYSPPVSKEQCLSIFQRFIDNQKPGLRALYKDSDSLAVQATQGVAIIEQLVRDGCSVARANDLVLLTLYRIVIFTGDSESMRNGTETLKKMLHRITSVTDILYPDGQLDARFTQSRKWTTNFTTAMVNDYVSRCVCNGITRLGTELFRRVVAPLVLNRPIVQPYLIIVFTDGTVEGESTAYLPEAMIRCVYSLQSRDPSLRDAVAFQFTQIGQDPKCDLLFRHLSNYPGLGGLVDCIPGSVVLEGIADPGTKWEMVTKILLGAILKKYKDNNNGVEIDNDVTSGPGNETHHDEE